MSDKLIDKVFALLAKDNDAAKYELHTGQFRSESHVWDCQSVKDFRNQLSEAGISFELVDRYGGEDQGSDYWSVYSFTDGQEVVFIKFDGWYASYDDSTYEEFYEVQSVEKTITVFEKK
jgi:hypothetical protein